MSERWNRKRKTETSEEKMERIDQLQRERKRHPSAITPTMDMFQAYAVLYTQATGEEFPVSIPPQSKEDFYRFFELMRAQPIIDAYVRGLSAIEHVRLGDPRQSSALDKKVYAQDIEAFIIAVRLHAAYIRGRIDQAPHTFTYYKYPTQILGIVEALESFMAAYTTNRIYLYETEI